MTREIKFRAWEGLTSTMITENVIPILGHSMLVLETKQPDFAIQEGSMIISEYERLKLQRVILMQYTGLKDKNGKEIYEGDIVKCVFRTWSKDKSHFESYREVGEVFYFDVKCGYMIRRTEDSFIDLHLGEITGNCEVMGNIYENPELLERNKDE